MDIWVIGRSYPTKKNKMRGSFEVEQAQMLAARGHRVTYLTAVLHPFNKVRKWGLDHFNEDGIDIYTLCIPFAPERMHLHPKRLLIWMWQKLLFTAEQHGIPDIIHVHYPGMCGMPDTIFSYRQKGVGIVVTDHWSKTLLNTMDPFQRKQLIAYANGADSVLCVSEPLKEALCEVSGTTKDVQVVPNIVSSVFKTIETIQRKDRFDFVVVGRLAPSKQVVQLTQSFVRAFTGRPNVHLIFVGGGTERTQIEKIIRESNMEQQICLLGTLSREETAKVVGRADALVSYSSFETFGVPVIEAWACGKPVVVSDAIRFLNKWDNALGLMVSRNDVQELEKALVQMVENAGTYDAKYLADFARSQFGEDTVYRKLMSAYAYAVAAVKE